jgi:hypothetical protein
MRIRLGVPTDANRDEKEAILNAALESVTRADETQLARGLPTALEGIKKGVRWKPEPPGDEHFDLGSTVLKRGWGDCDDLAPWHAASLRITGEDPEAYAFVRPSGPNRWHAVVQRSDGTVEDPSRAAGMGSVGGDEYRGPFWPSMFGQRFAMATTPLVSGYAARIDVPSISVPAVYSALARARSRPRAMRQACAGALNLCGESDDADGHDLIQLAGLHDMLSGADPDDVRDALEQEGVGFGFLAPAAMSLASPLLKKATGALGLKGGGGAQAAQSADAGHGGAPGIFTPHGPIIVRF